MVGRVRELQFNTRVQVKLISNYLSASFPHLNFKVGIGEKDCK